MKEIWKDIKGYEGLYQISNYGNVKSLSRQHWNGNGWWTSKDRILVPRTSKNKNHYYSVQLVKEGVKRNTNIHRIVAEHFLENPNNLEYVNHINENKLDNRVENLEWCSPKYNATYGNMEEVNKGKRKPIQFTHKLSNVQFILDYPEDYDSLGFNRSAVRTAVGRKASYKGYDVKYVER